MDLSRLNDKQKQQFVDYQARLRSQKQERGQQEQPALPLQQQQQLLQPEQRQEQRQEQLGGYMRDAADEEHGGAIGSDEAEADMEESDEDEDEDDDEVGGAPAARPAP